MKAGRVIGCGCLTVIAFFIFCFFIVYKTIFAPIGTEKYGISGEWTNIDGKSDVFVIKFDERSGECSMEMKSIWGGNTAPVYRGKFSIEEATLFHVKTENTEEDFVFILTKDELKLQLENGSVNFKAKVKSIEELDGSYQNLENPNLILRIDKNERHFSLNDENINLSGNYTQRNCLLAYCAFNHADIRSNSPLGNSQMASLSKVILMDFSDKNTFKSFDGVFHR